MAKGNRRIRKAIRTKKEGGQLKIKKVNKNDLVLLLGFALSVGWATLLTCFMILAWPLAWPLASLGLLVVFGLGMILIIMFIIFGLAVGLWLGNKIVHSLKIKEKRS